MITAEHLRDLAARLDALADAEARIAELEAAPLQCVVCGATILADDDRIRVAAGHAHQDHFATLTGAPALPPQLPEGWTASRGESWWEYENDNVESAITVYDDGAIRCACDHCDGLAVLAHHQHHHGKAELPKSPNAAAPEEGTQPAPQAETPRSAAEGSPKLVCGRCAMPAGVLTVHGDMAVCWQCLEWLEGLDEQPAPEVTAAAREPDKRRRERLDWHDAGGDRRYFAVTDRGSTVAVHESLEDAGEELAKIVEHNVRGRISGDVKAWIAADEDTGIGDMDDEEFIAHVRRGAPQAAAQPVRDESAPPPGWMPTGTDECTSPETVRSFAEAWRIYDAEHGYAPPAVPLGVAELAAKWEAEATQCSELREYPLAEKRTFTRCARELRDLLTAKGGAK